MVMKTELDLLKDLNPSALDEILLYLAFCVLRGNGYRHGAFLDAAATAAKCAIYTTYQEQDGNLRMTGHLHHIEPKRVKVIVKEIETALREGQLLKMLGSQEPSYLIELPFAWLEHYPLRDGQSPMSGNQLSLEHREYFEQRLPEGLPRAQVISSLQFADLIEFLHQRSQEKFPDDRRMPLSEALAEHIKRRLLHSETVMRLDNPWGMPYYVLQRPTYAPEGEDERIYTMVEDTARYFRLMREWAEKKSNVMRIFESLDIPDADLPAAQAELDELMRTWADKYHKRGATTMAVQMVFGEKDG
ncbi:heterocyst differentiation master regulator HetR [[Limnothrix rosea] IAM M-220]|uniref:heterocyst differentiation master regulator HetR n=1 Tax=[Limnothrix rosea] IAM M-220 TaxID=454133 RepID=UPI000A076225|nr:heterocyst differentiation master regulator HetR [[Limnothrix rosea] IAM M-220]